MAGLAAAMAGDTTPKLGYNARLVQRSIEKARKAARKAAKKAAEKAAKKAAKERNTERKSKGHGTEEQEVTEGAGGSPADASAATVPRDPAVFDSVGLNLAVENLFKSVKDVHSLSFKDFVIRLSQNMNVGIDQLIEHKAAIKERLVALLGTAAPYEPETTTTTTANDTSTTDTSTTATSTTAAATTTNTEEQGLDLRATVQRLLREGSSESGPLQFIASQLDYALAEREEAKFRVADIEAKISAYGGEYTPDIVLRSPANVRVAVEAFYTTKNQVLMAGKKKRTFVHRRANTPKPKVKVAGLSGYNLFVRETGNMKEWKDLSAGVKFDYNIRARLLNKTQGVSATGQKSVQLALL